MPSASIKNCPEISLVLTGAKRHKFNEVHSYAQKIGIKSNVKFVGYVPDEDLSGFYRRAHSLVMPTFIDPTNIPPLEALSLGCPVRFRGLRYSGAMWR